MKESHCIEFQKRFMENLLDRSLREICALTSSTRKIALISSFEDWMNTCSREFSVSYAHQSSHPSPIKLTYPKMKIFLSNYPDYLPRTEPKPENLALSLQIWDDFRKLVKLSKTKMKDLSNSTVDEAKIIGKRLLDRLQSRFLEDSLTSYQHELCLHLHIYLKRCLELNVSLRVIADLQLLERNNDEIKVFYYYYYYYFPLLQKKVLIY